MKKTTSKNLAKKLAQYGAMAAAIGTVAESNGQVVYTDITPDFEGDNNATFNIDLNDDGTIDFAINGGFVSTSFEQILVDPVGSNAVWGTAPSYLYPFALNEGDAIGDNPSWISGGGQILRYKASAGASSCGFASSWCPGDITDKYLGLRFEVGGNTHYGWVRLDVLGTNTTDDWIVKDFAFEATPDTPIQAGQTLSTTDQALLATRIFASDMKINLENLPEQSSYRVYNLLGQEVLSGDINQKSHSIDASARATGIYFLELTNVNTNAILRKKLILN
jgi:hypothetical protein